LFRELSNNSLGDLVTLAIVSILGILGMTFLFPVLAALVSVSPQRRNQFLPQTPRLAILIPAHNEERLLTTTLTTIAESINEAHADSFYTVRVMVGADGCTDRTEVVAKEMNAEVLRMPVKTGKWGTIAALVDMCSETDWIILADCGVRWPRDFIRRVISLIQDQNTIAIAPSYKNDASGIIEKVIWGTERAIKKIEAKSGGPVSVHGATICYRARELRAALTFLSTHRWINDDIVIPLVLRALYPTKKIEYGSSLTVQESPKQLSDVGSEFRRRQRLVHGNIQWINLLWGSVWRKNQIAALLACRRVFRVLWVYWVGSGALAVAYYSDARQYPTSYILLFCLVCTALVSYVSQLRNLFHSGLASALAPYYFTAAVVRPSPPDHETRWN
jgi:cellulose synthase/poly-beta-1,6-N-acetylglucosamine synthase-like glycosyltransferase